ncbi:Sars1 allergen SMIPP-C [Sarcoptes scabiei]|nr:Sars1 allergen SMIPP-C [Sarcoptes scabiei]
MTSNSSSTSSSRLRSITVENSLDEENNFQNQIFDDLNRIETISNETKRMRSKRMVNVLICSGRRHSLVNNYLMVSKSSKPSLFHAIVVIFLEFFAWGLLTLPAITVLNRTFPEQTFLMNGLIMGIKGFLSFLSAPLIGALSDLWGRKFFLLITVFFTCLPIPFMNYNPTLYFGLVIISGIFSVTFSVIFAYVADITEEHERSHAYGWVTATFALSLITSPALGAFISTTLNDDNLVILIATIVAIFDFIYILFLVPESLSEKLRQKVVSFWESADPFSSIRKAGKDRMILILCVAVFLSYLPEAGQYSCFFVYLKLVIGFSPIQVASYIALIGITSVLAQTVLLDVFMKRFGSKNTIMIGLIMEMMQLICFGLGSSHWIVWTAGIIAAIGTITYPSISAYVSTYADADKQGLVQGIITGIRGLCNGLGPFFFGLIFNLFNVNLLRTQSDTSDFDSSSGILSSVAQSQPILHISPPINQNRSLLINFINSTTNQYFHSTTEQIIPGPPFLFGALFVLSAILVMAFVPELIQLPPQCSSEENYISGGAYKPCRIVSPAHNPRQSINKYYYKNMRHHQTSTNDKDEHNQYRSIEAINSDHDSGDFKRVNSMYINSHQRHRSIIVNNDNDGEDETDENLDYLIENNYSKSSSIRLPRSSKPASLCSFSFSSLASSLDEDDDEDKTDLDIKQKLISLPPVLDDNCEDLKRQLIDNENFTQLSTNSSQLNSENQDQFSYDLNSQKSNQFHETIVKSTEDGGYRTTMTSQPKTITAIKTTAATIQHRPVAFSLSANGRLGIDESDVKSSKTPNQSTIMARSFCSLQQSFRLQS